MESTNNRDTRRYYCLTTVILWLAGCLSQLCLTQLADAFTASSSTVSKSIQCEDTVDGKQAIPMDHLKTSSLMPSSLSSFSPPFSTSIFDANETQIQLIPSEDMSIYSGESDSELMDALMGANSPIEPEALIDIKSDDKKEFELKLGKALDTLRKDYPEMLRRLPDFSIYHDDIETVDPSGFKLHNLERYKASFRFLHAMLHLFFDRERSMLNFKLVYDCARKNIRVSWNAYLVPRPIYGGASHALYVDGISVYELDRVSAIITHHRVEKLLLNDTPVQAPQGIFEAMRSAIGAEETEGVPVWNMDGSGQQAEGHFTLEFRQHTGIFTGRGSKLSLFTRRDVEDGSDAGLISSSSTRLLLSESSNDGANELEITVDSDNHETTLSYDRVAFEKKNASRKRFGLKPITPDEFIEIEAKVAEQASTLREKASAAQAAAEMAKEKEKTNILGNMLGGMLKDTCESNWDCERPKVCCDLIVRKMCCTSGMRILDGPPQLQKIPLRVPVNDGPQLPRGGPDSNLY